MEYKQKSFFRRKKDNSGSMAQFSLMDNKKDRSVFLELSNQLDEKSFDYEHKIVVKLNSEDLSQILMVLEGTIESIGNEGKGLIHSFNDIYTNIYFFCYQ